MSWKTADSSRRDQCPRMCPCQLLFYFNKDLGCVLSFNFPTECVPRPSGITSRFCCIKSKKKPEPAREVYNHHICDDLPSSPFGRRADSRTSWRTTTCRPVVAAVWEKPWMFSVFALSSLCSDTVGGTRTLCASISPVLLRSTPLP